MGVQIGGGLLHRHILLEQTFILGRGADGSVRGVNRVNHGAHLGKVALGLGQIGGQHGRVIRRAGVGNDLLAAGKQGIVNRQRDLRQGGGVVLGLLQLAVGVIQILLQIGNLLFQRGDLLVQLGDGIPQLGRHIGLLAVQLGLARVQLGLCIVQLLQAAVDFGLVGVQLLLGLGQTVADLHQQLVIDLVNFILVQRNLHGLFHKTGGGNAGHAVHALQLGQHGFVHIVGQRVDVHAVIVHGHILGGHHIGADFHQRGRAGHIGQRITELVHRGAGLDHRAVHIGAFLIFHINQAVVFVALARHVLHAVQRGQGVFQRLGDVRLDLLRACAGIGCDNQQIRQIHGGQQIGLDAHQTDKAQHQHQYDRHQNGKGLFYTVFWHGYVPFLSRPTGRSDLL